MGVIQGPEQLLWTAVGAFIVWAGRLLWVRISESTEKRRAQVDAQARLERENRLLKESLHEHRVLLIKQGISQDDLPDFMKDY